MRHLILPPVGPHVLENQTQTVLEIAYADPSLNRGNQFAALNQRREWPRTHGASRLLTLRDMCHRQDKTDWCERVKQRQGMQRS